MTTLKDIREQLRDYKMQHDRQPMNEQQVRAVLDDLLSKLQDVEAEMQGLENIIVERGERE